MSVSINPVRVNGKQKCLRGKLPGSEAVGRCGRSPTRRAFFLRRFVVSQQWSRLLTERLAAIAAPYRATTQVADADPHGNHIKVDHPGEPCDGLLTLSGGRSLGLMRQGLCCPRRTFACEAWSGWIMTICL